MNVMSENIKIIERVRKHYVDKLGREVGAMIPCATGGTFELDPPDAILDAVRRTFQQMAKEITEARRLLADIRADAQCAHWHQDIDAAMKGK